METKKHGSEFELGTELVLIPLCQHFFQTYQSITCQFDKTFTDKICLCFKINSDISCIVFMARVTFDKNNVNSLINNLNKRPSLKRGVVNKREASISYFAFKGGHLLENLR